MKISATRWLDIAERIVKADIDALGFKEHLNEFLKHCQEVVDKEFGGKDKLVASEGGKYYKIVKHGNQKMAWAFIDKSNGDVLKAASWNAPAKHARANIFDKASWIGINPYGVSWIKKASVFDYERKPKVVRVINNELYKITKGFFTISSKESQLL